MGEFATTKDRINDICQTHTSLSAADISIILQKSEMLQTIADLAQANVFIDCPVQDGTKMIVVAEASPKTTKPIYQFPLVEKIIYDIYEPAVFRTYRTGLPSMVNRAVTHEGNHVSQNVLPIYNQQYKVIGLLILEKDISTQINQEKELAMLSKTTEEMSRTFWDIITEEPAIPDVLDEGLLLFDEQGNLIYANNYAIQLIELHKDKIATNTKYLDKNMFMIFPFLEDLRFQETGLTQHEIYYDGKTYLVRFISFQPYEEKQRFLLYLRDLTEIREKERQLMVKSAVIQEIHHRVKNNLQTITSLLRLQMKRAIPEDARILLQDALHRVSSISTVHDILSHNGIEQVETKEIITRIVELLVNNHENGSIQITVHYEIDPVVLSSKKAVSVAMILTELIQNSIKHGFLNQAEGQLIVIFSKAAHSTIVFKVIDNGIGFIPGQETEQLGLEIVQTLSKHDLNGTFSIYPNEGSGTTAEIMFPIEEGGK